MSIATGLIAKLLLAVSVIPAAGYGGYCAYDHYNPTFHNQLIQQGFLFSPISGDMGSSEDLGQKRSSIKVGGDWRCSRQLFDDVEAPASYTEGTQEGEGTVPSSDENITSSETDSVGCLVADLGHVTDPSKKAGFLKWELALRSGNSGFIYVGYFSIGKFKDNDGGDSSSTFSQQSSSTVFEVVKEGGNWNIKNGLHWSDFLTSEDTIKFVDNFNNAEIDVNLANKHRWNSKGTICSLSDDVTESEKCGDKNQWEFKRYVGFWEQGTEGKQVTDAINIEVKEKENSVDKTYKHDIWQTTDFDFSNSNLVHIEKITRGSGDGRSVTDTGETKQILSWEQVSKVYEAQGNRWKNVTTASAKEYLTKIYKPWAKKKGTWMEAEGVCYESNSRSLKGESSEAQRLLKFCYKQQNKVS